MNLIKSLLFITFLSIFGLTAVHAQRPFVTVWNTTEDGKTGNEQIEFPGVGDYRYTYEDAVKNDIKGSGFGSGTEIITFPSQGFYRVSVYPYGDNPFNGFNCADTEDAVKLALVEQWGDIEWKHFKGAFQGAKRMRVQATDVPDVSRVTDMSFAFTGAYTMKEVPNMNKWDVSNVTNMQSMFERASDFREDISRWKVGKVTNMQDMFGGADTFNADISRWDVSNVTNMQGMFAVALAFNQPIGKWDVSKVTNMDRMFSSASNFNQNLNRWNVRNVRSMEMMFFMADSFDIRKLKWKFHPDVDQSKLNRF